jgi:hypothetical protein
MAANWSVSGLYCEACNCEAACPCVMLGPPTEDDCTVLVGWHIDKGNFERADKAQQDALARIFSGQAGGPPAALGAFIGEVLGVKSEKIDFRAEGKLRSIRIDGVADAEALTGQGGKDVTVANHPLTPVPGFPAVVSRSKRASYHDYGLALEVSGKNGFFSLFEYRP